MLNKYLKQAHISERKFRSILRYFSVDIDAKTTAELTSVSRNSINNYFKHIRIRIAKECEKNVILEVGEIELDESYFGGKKKGKRGRGAIGKIPVFGLLKRGNKVYTKIVNNCSVSEIMPIIEELAAKDSDVFTDGFKVYDGLVDYGYKQHFRVKHSENQFAVGRNHINGIESFWGLCKVRLSKFRGINKNTFYLHLKECEFRYNNRDKNLYKLLLKMFRKQPLNLS